MWNVSQVLALDPDAGENGTVRYAARAAGAAGGLRVHARSGRLYLAAPLPVGQLAHLTVSTRPYKCIVLALESK